MGETLLDFMEHDAQDTSIEAYKSIQKYKYGIESLYAIIIRLLRSHQDGYSINELATIMEKERSTISPRIKELRERNIIVYQEKRNSWVSGKPNIIWNLNDNFEDLVEIIE